MTAVDPRDAILSYLLHRLMMEEGRASVLKGVEAAAYLISRHQCSASIQDAKRASEEARALVQLLVGPVRDQVTA